MSGLGCVCPLQLCIQDLVICERKVYSFLSGLDAFNFFLLPKCAGRRSCRYCAVPGWGQSTPRLAVHLGIGQLSLSCVIFAVGVL